MSVSNELEEDNEESLDNIRRYTVTEPRQFGEKSYFDTGDDFLMASDLLNDNQIRFLDSSSDDDDLETNNKFCRFFGTGR